MAHITLRDIYWDEYGVGGMAVGDLVRAIQKGLPNKNIKNSMKWHLYNIQF